MRRPRVAAATVVKPAKKDEAAQEAAPAPNPAPPPPPPSPSRNKGPVSWIFGGLVVSTIFFIYLASLAVGGVQDIVQAESRAHVGNLGELSLASAPAAFLYDRRRGDLVYAGALDEAAKRTLVAVVREAPASPAKAAYLAGVERLAFGSVERSRSLILALLFLGGMAGTLGVQLRSIANFLGHACYKRDLNVQTWWPYYSLRPLTGFLLGAVLVAVVQAGFVTVQQSDPGRVMWWAALAFLAGFGDDEFTQRLRSVSQTLFGAGSGQRPTPPPPPPPPSGPAPAARTQVAAQSGNTAAPGGQPAAAPG